MSVLRTIISRHANPKMMTLKLPSVSNNWYVGAVLFGVAILTITIGVMPATAQQEDTVNLAFESTEDKVKQNTVITYDIVIEGVNNGIGTYQFTVENSDTQVAEITDAELIAYGGGLTNVSIADDGSEVLIEEATLDQEDPSGQEYILATVTIETANTSGESTFSISDGGTISNNDVEVYNLTTGKLEVEVTDEKDNERQNTTSSSEENTTSEESQESQENTTSEESQESQENTTSEDETPGFGILLTTVSLVGVALLTRQNN